jgi:Family of unknown function (DUF6326)
MTSPTLTKIEKPRLLSLLWIFLVLNFLYCDVLSLHDAEILGDLANGHAGPLQITPAFLLAASFLMEVPMSMVLISRLAPRTGNRIANIAAGAFMILVQVGSLFTAIPPSLSYFFFTVVEVATLAAIVVIAIRWKKPVS